jgi:Ca2+/Na+ antiporter
MENQPIRKAIATVSAVGIVLIVLVLNDRSTWVEPVATILLLCVTAVYVVLTHGALKVAEKQFALLKAQSDRQDQVLLFVDLKVDPPNLKVCVSNLGLSNVLSQSIEVRTSDDLLAKPRIFDVHRIVQYGRTEEIALPGFIQDGECAKDFEFTVHYVGIKDTGSTTPKCFNVVLFDDENDGTPIINIKDGLDAIWMAKCSKCSARWPIDVSGLRSFDVAIARMNQVQRDMTISCADHKSEYMMSDGTIKAAQKKRENRHKL